MNAPDKQSKREQELRMLLREIIMEYTILQDQYKRLAGCVPQAVLREEGICIEREKPNAAKLIQQSYAILFD